MLTLRTAARPRSDAADSQSEWVSLALRAGPSHEWRSLVVLGLLLKLAGSLLVLLTDLVELLHVLKEVGTSLQGDEQFGLLAVAALVVSSVA